MILAQDATVDGAWSAQVSGTYSKSPGSSTHDSGRRDGVRTEEAAARHYPSRTLRNMSSWADWTSRPRPWASHCHRPVPPPPRRPSVNVRAVEPGAAHEAGGVQVSAFVVENLAQLSGQQAAIAFLASCAA